MNRTIMNLFLKSKLHDYYIEDSNHPARSLKCQRLFRPKIGKVKTNFVFQIQRVSNSLTPNIVSRAWFRQWPKFPMAVQINLAKK